jgi:hypothetical protein
MGYRLYIPAVKGYFRGRLDSCQHGTVFGDGFEGVITSALKAISKHLSVCMEDLGFRAFLKPNQQCHGHIV